MPRIIKTIAKVVLAAVLGIIAMLAIYIAANWQDARNFPTIISAYYAKEACTCLYVLLREESQCHEMVRQYVPISSFENDKAARQVRVRGLGRRSVATFVDARHGCRLTD